MSKATGWKEALQLCPVLQQNTTVHTPCPALHGTPAAAQRGSAANRLVLLGIPLAVLGEGWMPKKSELEGENGCGWKQNHLSTGIVPTDQDDPTSISQRSLQAALAAILDGLGILLLMEATWIPMASYSWDLRAFTGLSNPLLLPNTNNSKNKYRVWLEISQ